MTRKETRYAATLRRFLGCAMAILFSIPAQTQTIFIEDIIEDDNPGGFLIEPFTSSGVRSVAPAGDVNNDGVPDVIVGAIGVDGTEVNDTGAAYVVFGKSDGNSVSLLNVSFGLGGFVIQGFEENSFLGLSVSGAGDINKDGFDDVIVGSPRRSEPIEPFGERENVGRAYVVFGKASTTPVQLSDLGEGGFIIEGGEGSRLGEEVAGGFDFNNDTIPDLLAAGPTSNHLGVSDRGKVTVVYGKSDINPVNVAIFGTAPGWFQVMGSVEDEMAGVATTALGDVNGDGFDDFAYGLLDNANPYVVVFGGDIESGRTETDTIAGGVGGFAIVNSAPIDNLARFISSPGDVNNDGKDDILVGSFRGFGDDGGAFVIFGKDTTTPVDLSEIKAGNGGGFGIKGPTGNEFFGANNNGPAGDINNDGFDDLLISDSGAGPNFSGRVYIVHGKSDFALVEVEGSAKGTEGEGEGEGASDEPYVIVGFDNRSIGEAATTVGDMNKDGAPDFLLLGGTNLDTGVYVVFGVPQGGGGCSGITHTADQNADNAISLSELLRVIQFFNSSGFGCEEETEDGYAPNDPDQDCCPHASDYNPQDWSVSLSELLRLIQFFNSSGYSACPEEETEDGFCPGAAA